jgi:hypothetical protein
MKRAACRFMVFVLVPVLGGGLAGCPARDETTTKAPPPGPNAHVEKASPARLKKMPQGRPRRRL